MRTKLFPLIAAALLFAASPALADQQSAWSGDITHFQEHDLPLWQSGHWSHTIHDGHMGWWWVIGDEWYRYSTATYPYPDPYLPSGMHPDTVPNPGTHYWYYCSLPKGYYPYVSACQHLWRRVASTTVSIPKPQDSPRIAAQPPAVLPQITPPTLAQPRVKAAQPQLAAIPPSGHVQISKHVIKKKPPAPKKVVTAAKTQSAGKKVETLPTPTPVPPPSSAPSQLISPSTLLAPQSSSPPVAPAEKQPEPTPNNLQR